MTLVLSLMEYKKAVFFSIT